MIEKCFDKQGHCKTFEKEVINNCLVCIRKFKTLSTDELSEK